MNERLLDNSSVVLLGSDGKLGNSFMKRFSSLGLKGIDYSDAHAAQHEVEAEIEAHKRLTFLVAVSAEYQVQVHQTLFKAIENARNASQNSTWIVNPNSVQDQVPKELEYRMNDIPENTTLFGLHPHHGHTLMNDGVVDKNWLVTYAKRFDRDQPKEEKATDIFKTWIKRKFREGAIADIALFDLNEAARPLPQFRNGAELHDKLTAYSQALVHMLRLLVDNDELFSKHFVTLAVDQSLSEAIVQQNPYAREGVFRLLKQQAPDNNDPNFIPELKQLALKLMTEYQTRFSYVPQDVLEVLKTPKFLELDRVLRA